MSVKSNSSKRSVNENKDLKMSNSRLGFWAWVRNITQQSWVSKLLKQSRLMGMNFCQTLHDWSFHPWLKSVSNHCFWRCTIDMEGLRLGRQGREKLRLLKNWPKIWHVTATCSIVRAALISCQWASFLKDWRRVEVGFALTNSIDSRSTFFRLYRSSLS